MPANLERIRLWRVILAMLLATIPLAGCGSQHASEPPREAPRPQVSVTSPLQESIIDWDEYTGRFDAIESVDVRARVSGYLESIHFRDGAIVEKGDLLFVIDRRPFEAALDQAKAEREGAEARNELAKLELKRSKALLQENAISQDQYDKQLSNCRQAAAQLHAARAAERQAELNLSFAEIRSPIRGRISRKLVDVGNLVSGGSPDSTLLTTIVSLDPIYFYFDVDEHAYLRYVRLASEEMRPEIRSDGTPVFAKLTEEDNFGHKGHVDFVDSRIGAETGTIWFRATFPNPDLKLLPGLFARCRIPASAKQQALLIPGTSVGRDQAIQFVYVLNDSNVVERRTIELGPRACGLQVVRAGVTAGDRIVTKGVETVRPGARVEPVWEKISLGSDDCLVTEQLKAFAGELRAGDAVFRKQR